MAILRREGCYLLSSRRFIRLFWSLPLLFAVVPFPLLAAEGTAHLTFQKAVPRLDNQQVYIIKNGDTIARIVRRLGRAAPPYSDIRQQNPHIPDLNRIYPGQKLILTREQIGIAGDAAKISNYTAKKGDSIARIIISELSAKPAEQVKMLRSIKQLNPDVTNFNKIYPGQILKIPRNPDAGDSDQLARSTPTKSADDEKTPVLPFAEKYLSIIRHVVEQLNGTVLISGNYYIPLPESGQVTVDCATIPVVELGDGTTILLDFAGRLPDDLARIIQSHWKNYHLVKVVSSRGIASVLQEIIVSSPSFKMVKIETPLSFDDVPQVKLSLDWLITRKGLSESKPSSQLGLIVAAEKSQLLPSSSIVEYVKKKGINVCQILGDKVQAYTPLPAESTPLPQLKGTTNDELLYNLFVYLGLEPLRDREVNIFDSRKDGFDLAIKAEYLVKSGGKTLLITKNKLPPQFSEKLKQEGITPFYLAPGATKISMLEGVLTALAIPSQFAVFSLPPLQEKSRVHVSFAALKIAGERSSSYLVDYDMDKQIYELLAVHWKLNIIGY